MLISKDPHLKKCVIRMRHKERKATTGIIFVITRDNFSICTTEYTAKRTCIPSHTIRHGGQIYSSTYSQTQQKMDVMVNFIFCLLYPSERDQWTQVQTGHRASLDILEKSLSPSSFLYYWRRVKNVCLQILFVSVVMCHLFSSCMQ